MDTGDSYVTTIGIDSKCMTTSCIGDHAIIESQKATTTRQKVTSILKEVESNLIRIQHTAQQIFSAPDCSKDLRTGEWSVKKEAHFRHWDSSREV
jgi:hypothetical protein